MICHISQAYVNKLKPTGKTTLYWDDTIKGFGLRARQKTMTYILKYRNAYQKVCWLTIGQSEKIKAELARELAKKALASIAEGKDPARQKQETKKEITIAEGRFLLKRVLELTETSAPIINRIIALKQYDP